MAKRSSSELPRPFVKWAGGKAKLIPAISERMPQGWGRFHEPFVGGGALFFALARERGMAGSRLTDGNQRLVRTYTAVRDQLDLVIARLEDMAVAYQADAETHYYEVRGSDVDALDDVGVAAWFIYLNKTGFNGLYRVNSKNRFNVPIGSYVDPPICDHANLAATSAALQGVQVEHADFATVLDHAVAGDFVYFDPPYDTLSDTAYFTSYTDRPFDREEQVRLRDVALALKRRGVPVLLSNHDTPFIREIYAKGFVIDTVMVRRAINSKGSARGAVAEVLIR